MISESRPSVSIALVSVVDHTTELQSTFIGNKQYFHASPDTSFEVKVNFKYPQGLSAKYDKILVCLNLDGEDVGYRKKLTSVKGGTQTCIFEGFYKNIDDERYKIFPFKFSGTVLADMRDGESSSSAIIKEDENEKRGTIEVTVFEAYEDLNALPTRFVPGKKGLPGGEASIDKDKKFWSQPSATVGCDENNATIKQSTGTSHPWRYKSNVPFMTCKYYYHTPNVIKILRLVDLNGEIADEEDTAPAVVPSASSSSSQGKSKGQKNSYDGQVISLLDDVLDAGSSKKKAKRPTSSTPIVIDLT